MDGWIEGFDLNCTGEDIFGNFWKRKERIFFFNFLSFWKIPEIYCSFIQRKNSVI